MSIDKNIIVAINDLRTGIMPNPVLDTSDTDIEPWQFAFTAVGIVGISFSDNEHCGCHLQRTEAQLRRLGAELRWAISCLPILNLLGSSDLAEEYAFTRLDGKVDLPGGEVLDYYRIVPWPGAIELVIGDNKEWGCRLFMAEETARSFADEIDRTLEVSESDEMRALLNHLGH